MPNKNTRRLASLDLFAKCRRADLVTIDRMACTIDLPAGRRVCTEGEHGAQFFVLLEGLAELRTASGTMAMLHPGAWFGETSLLDGAPRRATVISKTPITLLVFGKREFQSLLALAPFVRLELERTTARIIRGSAPTVLPWYQPLPDDYARIVAQCS
jgi:CRP-like cAMP-binding protein